MRRRTLLGAPGTLLAAQSSRPNILWFCTDQQRFDTIAALGNGEIRTPNLDKLVARGFTFDRTYCQTPICTASRASFQTGCHASTVHVHRNGNERFPHEWEERLISRQLSAAGYDCGMVGKFHLSSAYQRVEPRLNDGFRHFEWSHAPRPDWPVERHGYMRWLRDKGVTDYRDLLKRQQIPGREAEYNPGVPAEYHEVTWCADTAIDWIRGKANKPWFIHVNTYAPHPPSYPPREYLDRVNAAKLSPPLWRPSDTAQQARLAKVDFQSKCVAPNAYPSAMMKQAYYAQIEFIDQAFGRVVNALESTGQLDNTLIFFFSDHGETLGDHGLTHKGCRFYEGLARVPLIVSWPAKIRGGQRSKALTELTDLVPTVLDAAGLPKPAYLQGRSLWPALAGNPDPGREFVRAEYHDALDMPDHTHANMLRNERYKIVHYHGHNTGELYDLDRDPGEFVNLWDDPRHLSLRFDLTRQMLDAWMRETDLGGRRIGPM